MTSSSNRAPIAAPTFTAARSRTGRGCCSRSRRQLTLIWGPDRIGLRLSPLGAMNDISDDDPETTFGNIAGKLSDFQFAYLHIVNPAIAALEKDAAPDARAPRMSS
jgi:hypothetical protein